MAFDIEAYPAGSGFDIEIGEELAQGTTLAMMQAGSSNIKLVAAIEGYEYLLTDATPNQAVNAWSSRALTHHYESALGGLFVNLTVQQALEPYEPFGRGGQCTLHVVQSTTADTFGVDAHRHPTVETELAASIDRDDTTITVESTAGFDSSGVAYIGTECFSYTGTTATTFTGVSRGRYAPFPNGNSGNGFSQHHRVGAATEHDVKLNPLVTNHPRHENWVGKWVGVWAHKFDPAIGALNSADDAQLVYAGKIVSISDDPNTSATVVELRHVLDVVSEATVGGRDSWQGEASGKLRLKTGMKFTMFEEIKTNTNTSTIYDTNNANNLTVVASGAVGANQVNDGYYTLDQLFDILNTWWAAERVAGRLAGTYTTWYHLPDDGTKQTYIWWAFETVTANDFVRFEFGMPQPIRVRLGYNKDGEVPGEVGTITVVTEETHSASKKGSGFSSHVGQNNILFYLVSNGDTGGGGAGSIRVENYTGTFVDQYDSLPTSIRPATDESAEWGIFLINDRFPIRAKYNGTDELQSVTPLIYGFGYEVAFGNLWHQFPDSAGQPQSVKIRQIFIHELTLVEAVLSVFLSTGTTGYNDSVYDDFAHGIGLAIPGSLCERLASTLSQIPGADQQCVLVVDKTIRFRDVFRGDMNLRRAFLRWNNESLEFTQWRTPTAGSSIGLLSEANKAAPTGSRDHHRSITTLNGGWARPIVKIRFNRTVNPSAGNEEGYRDTIRLIDSAALYDSGGDGPTLSIDARNTYSGFEQTGAPIEALIPDFLATMPYFSRPARQTSRSIDIRFFEGYAPGDIVTVVDNFARDPETGQRGVQTRYAIITRHQYTLGGLAPRTTSASPMGGNVDLMLFGMDRNAKYVPCAQVDDTQANAGYNAGTGALTVYAHKHSESSEAVDAAHFTIGDKIRIVEIDPSDPASPTSWDRTIGNVSGNVITLTATLSAPAWDSAKKYRIVFDDYTDCAASQKSAHVFFADDADGQIQDARGPFEYGIGNGTATASFTAWTGTDPVELPPNSAHAEGAGVDVGHDVAMARLVNNLCNYKTANSSPMLSNSELNTEAWGSGVYRLVHCAPIYLSNEINHTFARRYLHVAPYFKSVDGTEALVRVSLMRAKPFAATMYDIPRGFMYSEVEFSTTSTTYAVATSDVIDMLVKDATGVAWLVVECNEAARTYGLAHVQEGPLVY